LPATHPPATAMAPKAKAKANAVDAGVGEAAVPVRAADLFASTVAVEYVGESLSREDSLVPEAALYKAVFASDVASGKKESVTCKADLKNLLFVSWATPSLPQLVLN
jgi:hypothetical protein